MANSQQQQQAMSTQLRHVSSHSFRDRSVSARLSGSAARLGSSSIPSSPTSVHSSSSAIFERDIEPISSSPPPPSHGHPHPPNPHRTPRSKQTEQLDQNVPSVLDSAAAILASSPSTLEDDRIGVVAPASSSSAAAGIIASVGVGNGRRSSGFTSPIGSFASRSPSPTMGKRTSVLLSTPSPPPPLSNLTPAAPLRANLSIQTTTTMMESTPNGSTPSIVTPTSAYYSAAESGGGSSTTTLEHTPNHQHHGPTSFPLPWSHPQPLTNTHPSHTPSPPSPPSPTSTPLTNPSKRISFISYTDLLASTPTSFHLLSSLTTAASTSEPPPHIPIVSGLITQSQSHTHAHAQYTPQHGHYYTPRSGNGSGSGSGSLVGGEKDNSGGIFDDLGGGEWEKEGMGGGLEERLEALLGGVAGGMLTSVR